MKSKLALLAVAALALTSCGGTQDNTGTSSPSASTTPPSPTARPTPGPEATPTPGPSGTPTPSTPGPSTPGPITPPGSGTPKPKPTPVPRAADGTNYKACSDARCEVAVRTGTRLPVKKSALGFTDVLVISRVSNGSVDYGAKGGCCSISTKAQKPGGTYTLNNLKVRTVAVAGKTAILRLSPA